MQPSRREKELIERSISSGYELSASSATNLHVSHRLQKGESGERGEKIAACRTVCSIAFSMPERFTAKAQRTPRNRKKQKTGKEQEKVKQTGKGVRNCFLTVRHGCGKPSVRADPSRDPRDFRKSLGSDLRKTSIASTACIRVCPHGLSRFPKSVKGPHRIAQKLHKSII